MPAQDNNGNNIVICINFHVTYIQKPDEATEWTEKPLSGQISIGFYFIMHAFWHKKQCWWDIIDPYSYHPKKILELAEVERHKIILSTSGPWTFLKWQNRWESCHSKPDSLKWTGTVIRSRISKKALETASTAASKTDMGQEETFNSMHSIHFVTKSSNKSILSQNSLRNTFCHLTWQSMRLAQDHGLTWSVTGCC